MLAILAKIVLDAGSTEAYIQAADSIMEPTRHEHGCTHYAFARDVEDPNVVWITEEWDSEQDLQNHLQSPHITAFLEHTRSLNLLSVEVRKYQVSSVGGL
jgi:quinol monooxygenase YgiN